jgi:hypothetical protein
VTTLSDKWAYTFAVLGGAATWIAVSQATGRREAWDHEIYFTFALPSLWVLSAGLGFIAPARAWRWGFVPFAAQAIVMIVQKPGGNLLPLGLILFAVFGAIAAVPAQVAAWIRRWIDRRSGGTTTD